MQIRLYVDADLAPNNAVELPENQLHYLRNVLRSEVGTEVFLFNGKDGEYSGVITDLSKKKAIVEIKNQLRQQPKSDDVTLYFAPLKRDCTELVVEKATELGATKIVPVMTEYTTTNRVNIERLQAIAIESCEQCRRLDVPVIQAPVSLKSILDLQNEASPLLVHLDETGHGKKIGDIKSENIAILVGPEGGFSDAERALIAKTPHTVGMDLGKRILRAETAAIAALSLFMCK